MEWRAHGGFEIEVRIPYVYVRAIGGWNKELLPILSKKFIQIVTEELLPHSKHWGVLFDVIDFDGQSSDAFSSWIPLLDWCSDNGQRFAAIVGPSIFGDMSNPIEEARKEKVIRKLFKSVDDADDWLRMSVGR